MEVVLTSMFRQTYKSKRTQQEKQCTTENSDYWDSGYCAQTNKRKVTKLQSFVSILFVQNTKKDETNVLKILS